MPFIARGVAVASLMSVSRSHPRVSSDPAAARWYNKVLAEWQDSVSFTDTRSRYMAHYPAQTSCQGRFQSDEVQALAGSTVL